MPSPTRHRDWERALEITRALYDFGWRDIALLLDGLGATGPAMAAPQAIGPAPREPAPVRLRKMLEALGPCFVKLGQVLSTRVDLLGPEWIAELSLLHNAVAQVPWDDIEAQLREDLGAPPQTVFQHIDRRPLAAASIAQVHAATLMDGSAVVVKVRRPAIKPLIEVDLRLLERIARLLDAHVPQAHLFRPVEMLHEFRDSLMRELDLAQECRHAERIARGSATQDLVVPKVYWAYTSERMNVQEHIRGVPIADIEALLKQGLDPTSLARRGARAVLGMMLQDGFFHADPHPGNIFALPGNRLALIDYGMVGHLDRTRRLEIVDLLTGVVDHDEEAVCEILSAWTDDSTNSDGGALAHDVAAFVDRYHGVTLGRLNFGAMLLDMAALVRGHGLALPSDLALVIKVCVTLEGLGKRLDPDFDMACEAKPFLRQAVSERYSLGVLGKRSRHAIAEALELAWALPGELRALLLSLRRGKAALHVESASLTVLAQQFSHATNRLTMGVVLAALVVGSAITMTVRGGPELFGLNVFGLMGFVGAVGAGSWLVASIWRSGGGR